MSSENPIGQKHSNRHHVYPKSRIPALYRAGKHKLLGKWLILHNVPIELHNALHAIFGNRIPEEQLELSKEMCVGGILDIKIYVAYKELFDTLFNGSISFAGMADVLKNWDLSEIETRKCTDKIAALKRVLNKDIKGGISVKKYRR